MKRFFMHDAESDAGEGMAYLEITDDWPTRQVEVYGDVWRWGDMTNPRYLADQSFEVLELGDEHEISEDEFEDKWREAKLRCRAHL
jgi:hypothetical protein